MPKEPDTNSDGLVAVSGCEKQSEACEAQPQP